MKTCLKCSSLIPNWISVKGKKHNIQNRKFCLICSPFKKRNRKDLRLVGAKTKICSVCKCELPVSEFYIYRKTGKVLSRCKRCDSHLSYLKGRKFKKKCVDYKGGKCEKCGYAKSLAAFDFHHSDPSEKSFEIGRWRGSNFEKIRDELDKCELLCANCHREKHEMVFLAGIEPTTQA